MTVREVIERLELYAREHGDNVPVRTFDLDRHMCDIDEVEFCEMYSSENYIYIGC